MAIFKFANSHKLPEAVSSYWQSSNKNHQAHHSIWILSSHSLRFDGTVLSGFTWSQARLKPRFRCIRPAAAIKLWITSQISSQIRDLRAPEAQDLGLGKSGWSQPGAKWCMMYYLSIYLLISWFIDLSIKKKFFLSRIHDFSGTQQSSTCFFFCIHHLENSC